MINQNDVAKAVSVREGKKIEVNIGQIKEVMKCLLQILSGYSDKEILILINKFRKKKEK